jgi:hypothetical protein
MMRRPPLVPLIFPMGLMCGLLAANVYLQYRTLRVLQARAEGDEGHLPEPDPGKADGGRTQGTPEPVDG